MKYVAKDIDVDSGGIVIADPDILGGDYSQLRGLGDSYKVLKISNGTYSCRWRVLNSIYDGKPEGRGTLKVTSGRVIVVDPSYVTEKFTRPRIRGIVEVDKTGGDGTFTIEFTLVRK